MRINSSHTIKHVLLEETDFSFLQPPQRHIMDGFSLAN
jgi:hypothetical protein